MNARLDDEIVFTKCPHCGSLNNGDVEVCLTCGVNICNYYTNIEATDDFTENEQANNSTQPEERQKRTRRLIKKLKLEQGEVANIRVIIILLLFLGFVTLLGVTITAYFIKTRNQASTNYLNLALECVEDSDPKCAYEMVVRAGNLGQKKYYTEPILLWSLEQLILQDTQQDYFQKFTTINQCLEIDPVNPVCLEALCIDSVDLLELHLANGNYEKLIMIINDMVLNCGQLEPVVFRLREQAFTGWYEESLEQHQYFKAWRIKKEWESN